jgi:hypothetical protein
MPPRQDLAENASTLISSMLTGGYDANAARWSGVVTAMEGKERGRAWAMLALASPRPQVEITADQVAQFREGDETADDFRTKLLVAGLAGLGRIPEEAGALAGENGVALGRQNRWTRLLERAVERRQQGTVASARGGRHADRWMGRSPAGEFVPHRGCSTTGWA